ncbi:hypothetical protein KCP70_10900 [Salmonella enterica subsp. enterica]|nr:hypothetical protein KCP70_10900 [Salmonella enterica subsp. enterica]
MTVPNAIPAGSRWRDNGDGDPYGHLHGQHSGTDLKATVRLQGHGGAVRAYAITAATPDGREIGYQHRCHRLCPVLIWCDGDAEGRQDNLRPGGRPSLTLADTVTVPNAVPAGSRWRDNGPTRRPTRPPRRVHTRRRR